MPEFIRERIILDLCGGTGAWSQPYREAGYDVRLVTLPDQDVRTYEPPARVPGILAAPPCTEFASSGARWWKDKPPEKLAEALELVATCLWIIGRTNPRWWALENPVGRLRKFIGPYRWTFHPWQFGDPWYKRTCVWGEHVRPTPLIPIHEPPLEVIDERHNPGLPRAIRADWIHRLGPSPERAALRSITPPAFARAFFEANR